MLVDAFEKTGRLGGGILWSPSEELEHFLHLLNVLLSSVHGFWIVPKTKIAIGKAETSLPHNGDLLRRVQREAPAQLFWRPRSEEGIIGPFFGGRKRFWHARMIVTYKPLLRGAYFRACHNAASPA
jgi:hypothetical protein